MMSRAEMEAVIDGGGSVLFGNHLITTKEQLPSEADLALRNPDPTAPSKTEAELLSKMEALQAEVQKLRQAKQEPSKQKSDKT